MLRLRPIRNLIIDMDGVLYHGNKLLPGVRNFVNWLKEEKKKFVFLTNSSERTPKELKEKLKRGESAPLLKGKALAM